MPPHFNAPTDTPEQPENWRDIQRNELLAAVYATSPDMILVHDADGRIIDANTQAIQRIGLSLDELCALPNVALLAANEVSPQQTKASIDAALHGEPQNIEWTLRSRSGEPIPVEVRLRAIQHDTPGSRAVVIAVIRDLSELKQTEAQRNLVNSRYQALVEQSLAGIYIIQDNRLRYCNPLFARMFGYASPEDLINTIPVSSLADPSDRERVAQNIRLRLESGVSELRYTFKGLRKDGSNIEVEVHGHTIDYEGRRAVIGVLIDVTEQKCAERRMLQINEELEIRVAERTAALKASNDDLRRAMNHLVQSEKLAALGSLVAGVAHELNTPLGNVLASASSLQDYAQEFAQALSHPESLRRSTVMDYSATCLSAAELIVRNAERAANLITNFKQVAVDQTSMQKRRFKLLEVVTEATLLLSSRIHRAAHEIETNIPDDIFLESHPGALDQIISNLIINSMTHGFTEGQHGKISLSASCQDDLITLEYADNGQGMPQTVADRAFEPFFTTRLGSGGSGLGLYTVYNLVTALLGGSIRLETAPGQGARFILTLPKTAPAATAENMTPASF
ncbi:PAS domain-containing sensor histidine kinase [Uliginosibacterium gangwonense]|uniref:PAS domain-containing sensor histidine kinase n=1 Tax=Uliginosibacterium gangwonense TaxID=392736 RepID=UPI00037369D3|nr:PAS domain S-box protein [Uliginosibacterium gangwonense]